MSLRQVASKAVGRALGPTAQDRFTGLLSSVDGIVEQGRRLLSGPSPLWQAPHSWRKLSAEQGSALIEELGREGLVVLRDFFDAKQLARVQEAVEAQFTPSLAKGMEFSPGNQYYVCLQPLAICAEFAEAAIDPDLLNLVSGYFRRRPFLSESDFRRVMPLDMEQYERQNARFAKGYSSSHWHHDLHGREVKVMVYLTDVGPDDQNFSYCLRSHPGFRSVKYEKSRFSDKELAARKLEGLECLAPAGTAIVFDTNGIHRLRRRNTRVRDSVTFNYRPGRLCQLVPQMVHPEALARRREEFNRLAALASS